ncbi:hypothetical protein ACWD4N_24135, partial [Streptomyces sp. NPDC002586]
SSDFVSGIIGPLLTEPGVDLVKAMYDRPLAGVAAPEAAVAEPAPGSSAAPAVRTTTLAPVSARVVRAVRRCIM